MGEHDRIWKLCGGGGLQCPGWQSGGGQLDKKSQSHLGLAGRAREVVHLGVGAGVQDGVVAFLQAGEYRPPSQASTGGKLGLLAAMLSARLGILYLNMCVQVTNKHEWIAAS